MIVFTLTNTLSGQVYVGTTQDCPQRRWGQLCAAAHEGLEDDLFSDIRHCGENSFELREWAVAESLSELRQLAEEALTEHDALSLQGIRTRPTRRATRDTTPQPSQASPKRSAAQRKASTVGTATPAVSMDGPEKLPTGRVRNSDKERKLRAAIEQQKIERLAQERAQQQAQADEMAAIMARIDSRGGKRS
ncbi:hypothetical protein [Motiliproteus sediminis]|uniref:hypothetical protein n=1 Tax=Motiliproteus sediminis TaxID=1468178 RepID=UPI001AEF70D0|nr:hypothetical protein [Motiliproteus sediminis]